MGQVKNLFIKNLARELVEKYPDKFSEDFESNKKIVASLTRGATPKIRNQIAGYITHMLARMSLSPSSNSEQTTKNE